MAVPPDDGGPIRTTTGPVGPTLSRATPLQRRGSPLWVDAQTIRGATPGMRHALIALSDRPWEDLLDLASQTSEVLLNEYANANDARAAHDDAVRWGVPTRLGTATSRIGSVWTLAITLALTAAGSMYDMRAAGLLAIVGTVTTVVRALGARARFRDVTAAWTARREAARRPLPADWAATQPLRRASLDEPDVEAQARAWLALDASSDAAHASSTRARTVSTAARRDALTER